MRVGDDGLKALELQRPQGVVLERLKLRLEAGAAGGRSGGRVRLGLRHHQAPTSLSALGAKAL